MWRHSKCTVRVLQRVVYGRFPSALQPENHSGIKLSDILRERMEAVISLDELFDAVMTLRNNKTPGGDGITVEFYRKFWKELKVPLYSNFMACMDRGMFSRCTRRGIINLIPKKGKNELYLKHWRPIVLQNVDFKIWSKAVANRLEETTHLIGPQQQVFIKNCSIFTNILTTWEVISHLKKKNKPGIVCLIDFEKCFDGIAFQSIKGTFEYFGFGQNFIKMLSMLFSNVELCTSSNGYMSKYMVKGRGTNQGDPSSPLIFSFCGEIMAHLILSNDNIKGIDLDGIKQVLSQFADDTTVFLSYELLTVEMFIQVLSHVEDEMGLKVSYEKTTMYRVGSLCNSNAEMFTQKNFKWSSGPIELLGVKINCNTTVNNDNFTDIMLKVNSTCGNWANRRASLFGKVLILNTLIGLLFVYKLSTMLYLTQDQTDQIDSKMRSFIWGDKKPKISLKTLQKAKLQGGLRLVDVNAKQDALRISWIFRLCENHFLIQRALSALNIAESLRETIWKCNLSGKDVKKNV